MADSFTQMCRFANTTAIVLFIFADNYYCDDGYLCLHAFNHMMSLIVGSLQMDDGGRYKNIIGRAEEAYIWTDLLVIGE